MSFVRPDTRADSPVWHEHTPESGPADASCARALRTAFGSFATGVCVVTAAGARGPVGMTVNSFSSLSLDPPLVMWAAAKSSQRFEVFSQAQDFSIHVLGADQAELAMHFSRQGQGFETLDGVEFDAAGVPQLAHCAARFQCRRWALHDAGDHALIIGKVLRAGYRQIPPLIFHAGRFGDTRQTAGPASRALKRPPPN